LQHDDYYKENGVPEFMSPEAFDFSWTQYQTLLVDKLNLLTQGQSTCPAGFSRPHELAIVSIDSRTNGIL
jgi:hypothetical protein